MQLSDVPSEMPAGNTKASAVSLILDPRNFQSMTSFAEAMASGKISIPDQLRNPGDCLAITMQALQWGMNPFAVARKTHVISGQLGYEAQLVNAVINSLAPVKDRIHYEWYGPWDRIIGKFEIKRGDKGEYRVPNWKMADEEGVGIRVWATFKGEDEPRVLDLLLAQARTRNSTLWADDPRQQLAYLAVKRWSRLYCPDVILGVYTPDELQDVAPPKEINPRRLSGTEAGEAARAKPPADDGLADKRAHLIADLELVCEDGIDAYAKAWNQLTVGQRKMVGAAEHERLKGLANRSIEGESRPIDDGEGQ